MSVTLYGLERSVYTRVARLALHEKAVPYSLETVEIFGPEGVPPAHLARHPFGRIPALEHDGFVLYETAAITRYVDESFQGPALQPPEATRRARMNQVIGTLDAYAYRPMVWGVFVERVRLPLQGKTADEETVRRSLSSADTTLRVLDNLLQTHPFMVGEALTLADLHAFPMLRYLALAPEGFALLQRYDNLARWFALMRVRESVAATASPYEMGPEIQRMKREQ
jgi:glutathione S-transferase